MALLETDDALVVRPSVRAQLPTIAILAVFLGVCVVAGATGLLPLAVLVIGILVFGSTLLAAVVIALRSRAVEWDLRLDAAGLSVRDRGAFPWSDVAEVRVTPLQPGRWQRFSLGYRVVAFVGRPGVVLPSIPSTDLPRPLRRWSERRRLAMVGTLLIIPPAQMNVRTAEVEAAVRRLSDVPVVHGFAGRTPRG